MYNDLTISGYKDDVLLLKEQLAKPYTVKQHVWSDPKLPQIDVEIQIPFSLWNIVHPPEDKLDIYFSLQPAGDETEYHWYTWNMANWDTKWDVSDVELVSESEDAYENSYAVSYRFATPWSTPITALYNLSEQYPELLFELSYEEENGWGGSESFRDGQSLFMTEYDVPDSHADYEERGQECICEWQDTQDWFRDCPADPEEWEWVDDETGRNWGNWKLKTKENVQ
jgi:hypothetical protein